MNEVPCELVPVHLFRARWCSGVFVIVMMPLKETRGQTPARPQLERNVRWMLARWFDGFGNFGSQPANHPSIPSWVSLCVAVLRYEDVKILKLICPGIRKGSRWWKETKMVSRWNSTGRDFRYHKPLVVRCVRSKRLGNWMSHRGYTESVRWFNPANGCGWTRVTWREVRSISRACWTHP